jgi:hypothetical protein
MARKDKINILFYSILLLGICNLQADLQIYSCLEMDWCWKRDQLKLLLFKSSLLIRSSSFTWLLPNLLQQMYNLHNIADVCMVNIGKASSCHRERKRSERRRGKRGSH